LEEELANGNDLDCPGEKLNETVENSLSSVPTENSISVKKEGEVKVAAESASLGLQVR